MSESLPQYWRALAEVALRGAQDGAATLPPPPPALAELIDTASPALSILDGLAVTWPLVAPHAPQLRKPFKRKTKLPPAPPNFGEIEYLWQAILDDPAARHWPAKKLSLIGEMLRYHLRIPHYQEGRTVPSWHLPALLDLAKRDRHLAIQLRSQLTPPQLQFTKLRVDWHPLNVTFPPIPEYRELVETVRDRHAPLEDRQRALRHLTYSLDNNFGKHLRQLAEHCFQQTGARFEVTPLDPSWHTEWLPPAVLPTLPTGIAPRNSYLARAYAVLGLVDVARWFPDRTPIATYKPDFVARLTTSEHPAALAYAFGTSIKAFGAKDWIPQLVKLYSLPPFAPILDETGALERVADHFGSPPGTACKWLLKEIDEQRVLTAHSPLLEILVRLRRLDRRIFERATRAILTGLVEDSSQAALLKPVLNQMALHAELYWNLRPADALSALAERSPAAADAWKEAYSLLLFRHQMRDAYQEHFPGGVTGTSA